MIVQKPFAVAKMISPEEYEEITNVDYAVLCATRL
jgi:hypothetical protein